MPAHMVQVPVCFEPFALLRGASQPWAPAPATAAAAGSEADMTIIRLTERVAELEAQTRAPETVLLQRMEAMEEKLFTRIGQVETRLRQQTEMGHSLRAELREVKDEVREERAVREEREGAAYQAQWDRSYWHRGWGGWRWE